MVYFPSCISRVFGAYGKESMADVLESIANRTGIALEIPEGINAVCCGQPFFSKGFSNAGKRMADKTISLLQNASENGTISVLVDTSPCTAQLLDNLKKASAINLQIVDIASFLKSALENHNLDSLDRKVLIHPSCSSQKMETESELRSIAEQCASDVEFPEIAFCCGFAGDRGLTHPELSSSATEYIANQWKKAEKGIKGYATSRTCEIGLKTATHHDFLPIAVLVRDYLIQENENAI